MEVCKAVWEVRAGLSAETGAATVMEMLEKILDQAPDDAALRQQVAQLTLTWPRGMALPELTRRWAYTSSDFEADRALLEADPEAETRFMKLDAEAREYADQLRDPRRLNWVRLDWHWI